MFNGLFASTRRVREQPDLFFKEAWTGLDGEARLALIDAMLAARDRASI